MTPKAFATSTSPTGRGTASSSTGNCSTEPGFLQAGICILVGNAAEETIYIGEADPVGDRLKNHVSNKEGWVWGVYFFDRNHKIGKRKSSTWSRHWLLWPRSTTEPFF